MGNEYLIDTHILLWWIFNEVKLDRVSREIIQTPTNEIYVSSASAWEISTKYRIGKLPEAEEIIHNYAEILQKARFSQLSITTTHALRAGALNIDHRDPFDRMIMAQGQLENMTIITHDPAFKQDFIKTIPS